MLSAISCGFAYSFLSVAFMKYCVSKSNRSIEKMYICAAAVMNVTFSGELTHSTANTPDMMRKQSDPIEMSACFLFRQIVDSDSSIITMTNITKPLVAKPL